MFTWKNDHYGPIVQETIDVVGDTPDSPEESR